MSAAVEPSGHPRRSQPHPELRDAVFSAELFDPGGELRILHRGRLYRLRVARAGHLELVGPKETSRTPGLC
ncbi:hemin uptake protein HemP [Thiocapsa marina]|uniref:Hemin uptake protein hemP n=1 Tax=Thiocapsa marina 5811 TaxID=768671 RepID=F9UC68_9GAMM|nr:hemin uptake protein HemP [Thiocapsa marina]EGV17981.1 Hemin uptake protein hemP [Thiocapsa marina 5811]